MYALHGIFHCNVLCHFGLFIEYCRYQKFERSCQTNHSHLLLQRCPQQSHRSSSQDFSANAIFPCHVSLMDSSDCVYVKDNWSLILPKHTPRHFSVEHFAARVTAIILRFIICPSFHLASSYSWARHQHPDRADRQGRDSHSQAGAGKCEAQLGA